MKNLLRLEELAQLLAAIGLLIHQQVDWYWYLILFLGPDVGMLGYLVGPKVGAITYNLFHHKAIALALCVAGVLFLPQVWYLVGVSMYGHSSMDRVVGYGLKYLDDFKHTHLGTIGH